MTSKARRAIGALAIVAVAAGGIALATRWAPSLARPDRVERTAPADLGLPLPVAGRDGETASDAANATPEVAPQVAASRAAIDAPPIAVATIDLAEQPVGEVALRIAPTLASLRDEATDLARLATDAAGRATLDRAAIAGRGGFWLLASRDGFVPTCQCVATAPLLEAGELKVTLDRRATLAVVVVDPREQPIAGVEVRWIAGRGLDAFDQLGDAIALVEGGLFARGTTDAEGKVALPLGEELGGHLAVDAPPWLPGSFRITPEERKARSKRVQLAELVVAGWRVVDAATGATSRRSRGSCDLRFRAPEGSLEDLPYWPHLNQSTVEAEVRARLSDPAVELLAMALRRDDELVASLEITITPDGRTAKQRFPIRFVPVDEFVDDDVLLVRSDCRDDDLAALTIAFVDPDGAATVPSFDWMLEGERSSLLPTAPRDGRFDFLVSSGRWRLVPYADGFRGGGFAKRAIELNPGTRQEIVVTVDPAPPSAAIRARAFESTGEPVRRWLLVANTGQSSTPVGEDEHDPFVRVLPRVRAGRVKLNAYLGESGEQVLEVDLAPEEVREVEFTFR